MRKLNRRNDPRQDGQSAVESGGPVHHTHPRLWTRYCAGQPGTCAGIGVTSGD